MSSTGKPACLIAIAGEITGSLFDLGQDKITIGRGTSCQISLNFNGISRNHCEIIKRDKDFFITDLNSSNGTSINGQKITNPIKLKKEDNIQIGTFILKFVPEGDPERETYEKLQQDANTDGLTGAYNKTYCMKALDLEMKKSLVSGYPLSLVILDLDHFKKLNDTYGHDAGDFVLKNVSKLIQDKIKSIEGTIFARYGGEEFVLLCPNTAIKNAFEISETIRGDIEKTPFKYDGHDIKITVSIGIADYRQGVKTSKDLFKRADEAVYQSKNSGRNQVNFYRQ